MAEVRVPRDTVNDDVVTLGRDPAACQVLLTQSAERDEGAGFGVGEN